MLREKKDASAVRRRCHGKRASSEGDRPVETKCLSPASIDGAEGQSRRAGGRRGEKGEDKSSVISAAKCNRHHRQPAISIIMSK